MFYDTFKELCTAKGVSVSKAAVDIGLNNSTPTSWKKRGLTPKSDTMSKIANYFGVSVDYILNYGMGSQSIEDLAGGVHIYKSVTPTGFAPNVMEQIDTEIEEIVYQNSSVVITKDIGSDVSKDVIDRLIETYENTEKSKLTGDLTSKEQRDIAKEVEQIMASLSTSGDLMLDGVLMSDDAKRNLAVAMETALGIARKKNQETYTPKKYKAKE